MRTSVINMGYKCTEIVLFLPMDVGKKKHLFFKMIENKPNRHRLAVSRELGRNRACLQCDQITKVICNENYERKDSMSFETYLENNFADNLLDPIISYGSAKT